MQRYHSVHDRETDSSDDYIYHDKRRSKNKCNCKSKSKCNCKDKKKSKSKSKSNCNRTSRNHHNTKNLIDNKTNERLQKNIENGYYNYANDNLYDLVENTQRQQFNKKKGFYQTIPYNNCGDRPLEGAAFGRPLEGVTFSRPQSFIQRNRGRVVRYPEDGTKINYMKKNGVVGLSRNDLSIFQCSNVDPNYDPERHVDNLVDLNQSKISYMKRYGLTKLFVDDYDLCSSDSSKHCNNLCDKSSNKCSDESSNDTSGIEICGNFSDCQSDELYIEICDDSSCDKNHPCVKQQPSCNDKPCADQPCNDKPCNEQPCDEQPCDEQPCKDKPCCNGDAHICANHGSNDLCCKDVIIIW